MDNFAIDPKSPVPVWAQAKGRLLYLILSGQYKEGQKLPTVRDLAVELNINYNTVNKAYQDLERDGYVSTIRGKGAFVTDKASKGFNLLENDVDYLMDELIAKGLSLGMTGHDLAVRFLVRLNRQGHLDDETTAEMETLAKEA